jgi:hypothetical protein
MIQKFWDWYEKHHRIIKIVTAILFVWQLIHLYWLAADILAPKVFGRSFWPISEQWNLLLAIVDYTEIPALLSATLLYINEIRQGKKTKGWTFVILLNSQWFHLFWITDEFVKDAFVGNSSTILPAWLAIIAILIDYLELPVIYDTIKQALTHKSAAGNKNPPQ